MKINLHSLAPFIIFALGYILMAFLTQAPELSTPDLLGKPIFEGLSILSAHNLNARILKEKESIDLPDGIILSQTPNPNNKIKQNQSVFLVISKRPEPEKVPSVIALTESELETISLENNIKTKIYKVPSIYPNNTIISQEPTPGAKFTDLKNKNLTVYMSQSQDSLKIFPNFKDISLEKVIEFLNDNKLKFEIYHNSYTDQSHICNNCKVIEQRPLFGSFIDPKKNFTVYLTVN